MLGCAEDQIELTGEELSEVVVAGNLFVTWPSEDKVVLTYFHMLVKELQEYPCIVEGSAERNDENVLAKFGARVWFETDLLINHRNDIFKLRTAGGIRPIDQFIVVDSCFVELKLREDNILKEGHRYLLRNVSYSDFALLKLFIEDLLLLHLGQILLLHIHVYDKELLETLTELACSTV